MGNEELRGTKDECLSEKAKKQVKKLRVSLKSSIFAVGRQLLPLRSARSDACQSKNFAFYNFQIL